MQWYKLPRAMLQPLETSARAIAIARRLVAAIALVALGACTPQAQLLMSLIPDGTIPMLLSHFERVDDTNRRRISEFEQRRAWAGLARFAEENLKVDKSNSDWWTIAGYAYSQAGQRKRATACYTEVVRLSPEDALGWNLLAQSYRLDGQPERALQIVNRALNVNRETPPTWILLGHILSDLNRLEPAVKSYQEAIRLDQRYGEAWLGLGKAYSRLGKTAEVREVAKVLEKLDPALARELAGSMAK
jgi:tetratricopeptide (TPR) repeat protein